MKKHSLQYCLWAALVLLLLFIDQFIKVWVKTHMHLGDSIHVFDWFYISFIENNGMAYGMTFINKWVLSSFRIVAVLLILYYIYKVVRHNQPKGYILCLCLILAGATGNIIDCLFYGQIFSVSSPWSIAQLVSFGTGYAPMLQGRVVDMLYFPLFHWPQWMPLLGGDVFFSPVFNFADSCISVGVVALVIFYRNELETLKQTFLH